MADPYLVPNMNVVALPRVPRVPNVVILEHKYDQQSTNSPCLGASKVSTLSRVRESLESLMYVQRQPAIIYELGTHHAREDFKWEDCVEREPHMVLHF